MSNRSSVLILMALLTVPSSARALSPGDILVSPESEPWIYLVNPSTGDRSVFSGCTDSSCTSVIGSGPYQTDRDYRHIAVSKNGTIIVGGGSEVLLKIDPSTGDRSVLSCRDQTGSCFAVGQPWSCCTGSATSDGTPPCAAVGTGPDLEGTFGIAVFEVPTALTGLQSWGVLAVIALIVVSARKRAGLRG